MAMQQVTIGRDFDTWGTVKLDDGKLSIKGIGEFAGPLNRLIQSMDRPHWTDKELFLSLPQRLASRIWCSPIQDENGQPLEGDAAQGKLPDDFF